MKKATFFLCMILLCAAGGCSNALGLAEDEYSILLYTAQGTRHAQTAQYYKEQTETNTSWKGLYIVHKENESDLYWGKYPNPQAAQDDLRIARTFKYNSRAIYPMAMVVPLAGKSIGPAEYELKNAKGYWTVLVAIFVDDPDNRVVGRKRMTAAVEYCKYLREHGYQAYYHHMSARSQVTVGGFPENAVVMVLKKKYHVQRIQNARMLQIMNTEDPPLKYLAVNGHQEIITSFTPDGKTKKVVSKSRPIPIPKKIR